MDRVSIKVRQHDKRNWAALCFLGNTHLVCAEAIKTVDAAYSFIGGHRVRLFQLRKNVNWVVPIEGEQLDISAVAPEPPRRQGNR